MSAAHDCPGLWQCMSHPRIRVLASRMRPGRFFVIPSGPEQRTPWLGSVAGWGDAQHMARVKGGASL